MFLHGWMMTVSSFSSVLKSAVTLISASALGFPGNLFAFQYINFTHSLLSLVDSEEVMSWKHHKPGTV